MREIKDEIITGLFFFQLLYLVAVFDFVHENLGRFKAWNKVLINNQGGVARNVSGNLFLSFLVDETPKTTNVNVVSIRHRALYDAKECLNRCCYIRFVNSCLFCDFINNVCFGHCVIFLVQFRIEIFTGGQI
jgi:hypothetical protein